MRASLGLHSLTNQSGGERSVSTFEHHQDFRRVRLMAEAAKSVFDFHSRWRGHGFLVIAASFFHIICRPAAADVRRFLLPAQSSVLTISASASDSWRESRWRGIYNCVIERPAAFCGGAPFGSCACARRRGGRRGDARISGGAARRAEACCASAHFPRHARGSFER